MNLNIEVVQSQITKGGHIQHLHKSQAYLHEQPGFPTTITTSRRTIILNLGVLKRFMLSYAYLCDFGVDSIERHESSFS